MAMASSGGTSMKLLTVAAMLFASPLSAEVCQWNSMFVDISPSPDFAIVTFHNELTSTWGEVPFYCPVTIDGVMVRAVINAGNGNIPDNILVEVPLGYEAIPQSIDVEEGEEAVIIVRPIALS